MFLTVFLLVKLKISALEYRATCSLFLSSSGSASSNEIEHEALLDSYKQDLLVCLELNPNFKPVFHYRLFPSSVLANILQFLYKKDLPAIKSTCHEFFTLVKTPTMYTTAYSDDPRFNWQEDAKYVEHLFLNSNAVSAAASVASAASLLNKNNNAAANNNDLCFHHMVQLKHLSICQYTDLAIELPSSVKKINVSINNCNLARDFPINCEIETLDLSGNSELLQNATFFEMLIVNKKVKKVVINDIVAAMLLPVLQKYPHITIVKKPFAEYWKRLQ